MTNYYHICMNILKYSRHIKCIKKKAKPWIFQDAPPRLRNGTLQIALAGVWHTLGQNTCVQSMKRILVEVSCMYVEEVLNNRLFCLSRKSKFDFFFMAKCGVENHDGLRQKHQLTWSNKGCWLHNKETGIQVRIEKDSLTPPSLLSGLVGHTLFCFPFNQCSGGRGRKPWFWSSSQRGRRKSWWMRGGGRSKESHLTVRPQTTLFME